MVKVFASVILLLVCGCAKNSEQTEAAKKQLASLPIYNHNLDDYQFNVVEIPDRDVYEMLSRKYQKSASTLDRFPEVKSTELDKAMKYAKLSGESDGEVKFYRVHAFRIAGDTLDNVYLFFNERNEYLNRIDR